ncbi:MAG: HAMP domain-containing histidine kinase [Gemmatirosa sp.]|nr:HAMP domain-containing histidine kinase [Gemmatirosa sp.]
MRRTDALRAPQLMLLLLATLAVAALAALEAEGDVGAHRATAERALGDYLAVAGQDAVDATLDVVLRDATEALAPAAGTRASSPYDLLPSPEVLARSATGAFVCPADGEGRPAAPSFVRLDLRDASLATAGAPVSAATERWLRDTLAIAKGETRAVTSSTMPVGVLFGRGPFAGRAVVYAVARAPFDAPIAVYGVVTCASALGRPLVERVARARPGALRPAVGDSLLVVAAGDAGLLTGPGAPVARAGVGGLDIRAWRGPGAERRLVVRPGRGSRLALLGVLAAVTATLVFVALAQLGREQELVRLRADFTSSVSHELRTPLAQILLYGETLALGRARGDADRRAAAETIVREARRLMHMVENVLHVARAERRANGVRPTAVALEPLALDVVAGFAPLAAAGGATVDVDVPATLVARAEPGALRQMLLNLLDNAVRYGPPGQVVHVGGAGAGDVVRLWVDDEGPGVPPRDRERIWSPFVRLARDRVTAGADPVRGDGTRTGSGLGLAVVRDLAALHGGRAWVEDVAAPSGSRGGARFVVELPAVHERERGPVTDEMTAVDLAAPSGFA